jgi:hypothetical protein
MADTHDKLYIIKSVGLVSGLSRIYPEVFVNRETADQVVASVEIQEAYKEPVMAVVFDVKVNFS